MELEANTMTKMQRSGRVFFVAVFSIAVLVCSEFVFAESEENRPEPPAFGIEMLDQMTTLPGDIGPLPDVPVPTDNPQTPEKVELGRKLYFDKQLSGDKSMSCATCHSPTLGYGDGKPRAIGFGNKELGRHSPTVLNTAYNHFQFWDGRALTLEEQAKGPIMAPGEMNVGSEEVMLGRLNDVSQYKESIQKIFGEAPSLNNVAKAIAAFERTIVTKDSPFDRYAKGDKASLTDAQKRGLILFIGKANCTACHNGPNFTDNKFHNLGAPQEGPLKEDLGRYGITKDEKDKRAFKTPSVRNAELTAPYLHDGSMDTLEKLIDFYNKGGGDDPNKSELIFPLNLSAQEKQDLITFIKSLTGTLPKVEIPIDN